MRFANRRICQSQQPTESDPAGQQQKTLFLFLFIERFLQARRRESAEDSEEVYRVICPSCQKLFKNLLTG